MEELKACLLPCNLEQLNDRILNLANGIASMGEQDTIRVRKAFLVDVLGYMDELLGLRREEESRRAAPENKLTCAGCVHNDPAGDAPWPEICYECKRQSRQDMYRNKPEGSET